MDIQVRCGFCGASNLSSAFSCSECFLPLVDELHAAEAPAPVAAETESHPVATVAPAPPARLKPLGPYTGPRKEKAAVEAPVEEPGAAPDADATTAPRPGYRIGGNVIAGRDEAEASAPLRVPRDPNRVVWRWYHVAALALLAWGIPFAIDWWLGIDRSIVALLNRALAVQVAGHLMAGFAVAAFVWTSQSGDWSTLGFGDDARKGRLDLLRGVGFGLAMFLGYLPVGLFTNGRTSLDPMVSLLLGSSNGVGLVLTGAAVVVGAPVIEEIFFRGVLYEKIARRFPQMAIIVTGVLFMLVHRAIVLQILVLGLVFAIKRSKGESLWFTIGAHAAWNAGVLVVGVVMLTGSAVHFTSSSNSYDLRYAKEWERQTAMEASAPGGHIELGLTSANGSMMAVVEFTDVPSLTKLGSGRVIDQLPGSVAGASGPVTNVTVEPSSLPGASEAYDITATIPIMGKSLDYKMVAARPDGSGKLVVFMVACPHVSCDPATEAFDEMMDTVTFH